MKLKGVIMSVFAMMMVTLCGLHLLSCGDKEDDGFRNNNNGGGSTNVPQELLGAWQESNAQGSSVKNIYVFNADGTGKIYIGWDYTDNKAREVQSFVYSYNSQNSTLVFSGRSYTLAFKYGNTQMDWLIGYNDVFLSFYRHEGMVAIMMAVMVAIMMAVMVAIMMAVMVAIMMAVMFLLHQLAFQQRSQVPRHIHISIFHGIITPKLTIM